VPQKRTGGKFFAVDRRTWGQLCNSAAVNQASTYLVLAQGTDRENRYTNWSTTSLKRYAGISWDRGKVAIEGLIRKGFIARAEGATVGKPRYELRSYSEIERAGFDAARAALTDLDRHLVGEIRAGRGALLSRKRVNSDRLRSLEERGIITRQSDGSYTAVDVLPPNDSSDLIWLPNTLVTGTEAGEEPPVRRLRCGGDLWTLRLFIDLYHAQNLRDDGGISPGVLQQKYSRMLVGEQGIFKVWGFKPENQQLSWCTVFEPHESRPRAGEEHPVWGTIQNLRNHGVLSFVPHLWDRDWTEGGQAEIVHAYGVGGCGEALELEMGSAALRAALSMVPDFKIEKAFSQGYTYLAPIRRTVPNVQMIGVARLRYRPHTTRTSDWYGDLVRNAPGWTRHYQELIETGEKPAAKSA
jgi:hypothetical protein